jgi:putative addiction module component (TIGR02574 family)
MAKGMGEMHTDSMGMTMDQSRDETTEAAWSEEIHRRITDLETGRVQGIPLEETLAKARVTAHP